MKQEDERLDKVAKKKEERKEEVIWEACLGTES